VFPHGWADPPVSLIDELEVVVGFAKVGAVEVVDRAPDRSAW
jgi:hypothetical protein